MLEFKKVTLRQLIVVLDYLEMEWYWENGECSWQEDVNYIQIPRAEFEKEKWLPTSIKDLVSMSDYLSFSDEGYGCPEITIIGYSEQEKDIRVAQREKEYKKWMGGS